MQVPSLQLYPGDIVSVDKEAQNPMRQGMRDFLNRQEEQGGLKKIHTKHTQDSGKSLVWYKNNYCEVNYKTLDIVILFSPQHVHYPMRVHTEKFTKIFKR